ncbi:Bug family tripartite tricarboxylate transporter substrate binding protein [Ruegeria lacuscaerulensis]|uniref:Bug family tripartite tricarboxylate transporter substrate binding protein n=1 Tax=Ruegeria lacuscaerulensis TaxID=55218 RepID=UPI001F354167|nr:tripartite tricarboxylate transporter substrate-binding protein [Ruegeria lacuscaerulensis]
MLRTLIKPLAVSAASVIAFTGTTAQHVAAADFSGQRIEWIIPFKEGGGSDRWSRFYAPLLSEQLPGQPTIVVKNIPGGGSTKGANQFQARAEPDGKTLLGTSGSTQLPYLLGDKRVNYEYKDWTVVLATGTGAIMYINPELGVEKAADLVNLDGTDLKFGSQGATSLDLLVLLGLQMLEVDVSPVFGMKGRGAARLAFERGEVNLDYQTSASFLTKVTPLVEKGKAVPIMTWGFPDGSGNIVRDPTFPDLPSFPEVYEQVHGKAPSGQEWEVWKSLYFAGYPAQKMIFLPNETPDDIVQAYRDAAQAVISAPDFAERAEAVLGTYPQAVGEGAETMMQQAVDLDEASRTGCRTG